MLARFRLVSMVESVTYLVLLGAVAAHRVFDGPDLTPALGPVHGIAFLAYFLVVLHLREHFDWDLQRTVVILFAAVVPLGGFVVAHRLARPPAAGAGPSPHPG